MQNPINIPVTMCHGTHPGFTLDRFKQYLDIAAELGFNTINYDQLYAWLQKGEALPPRPILIDFDHPMMSIYAEIFPLMQSFGYTGNLFINTGVYDKPVQQATANPCLYASWERLAELAQSGWTIGAHTHSHPDLSDLAEADPDGTQIAKEMDKSNALIKKHLGFDPLYFAFTGGATGLTWSSVADREAKKRYRLGRLWIMGLPVKADGKMLRHAEFVGLDAPDEADGGPPHALRYITRQTLPFQLPSMELEQGLIYPPESFRRYLETALSSKAIP